MTPTRRYLLIAIFGFLLCRECRAGLIRQLRAPAFRLLVSRRFGPLFATQSLSAFNDNALRNALVEAGTFIAILLGTIAGMVIATRHGSAAVAGLIVAVALAAWGASRQIPPTTPAARG
jgi:hypothetical protein